MFKPNSDKTNFLQMHYHWKCRKLSVICVWDFLYHKISFEMVHLSCHFTLFMEFVFSFEKKTIHLLWVLSKPARLNAASSIWLNSFHSVFNFQYILILYIEYSSVSRKISTVRKFHLLYSTNVHYIFVCVLLFLFCNLLYGTMTMSHRVDQISTHWVYFIFINFML